MSKKTIFWIIGGLAIIGLILLTILIGGPSRLFQGALYNLRPIYSSCRIEGENYNSTKLADCENFHEYFLAHRFPDGEYTIFTKYADKKLSDNIIPVKIQGNQLSCDFLSNGYQPTFRTFNPLDTLTSQSLKPNDTVPVGSSGLVVELFYQKNGQQYFYDTNICESAFQASLKDNSAKELGTAKLDYNGFINSRPLVNQIFISDHPYYQKPNGENIKTLQPGNATLSLSPAPDITFKLTVPCSNFIPEVQLPNLEISGKTMLNIQGITPEYFNNCGSRLYLSFQNTNQASDIQAFNGIKWSYADGTISYDLDPIYLGRVTDPDTVFPISFKVSLHLRDRSDDKNVYTLGSGILTVTGHKIKANQGEAAAATAQTEEQPSEPDTTEIIPSLESTSDLQTILDTESASLDQPLIIDSETAPEAVDLTPETQLNLDNLEVGKLIPSFVTPPKVRHRPEPVLVIPNIPDTPTAK